MRQPRSQQLIQQPSSIQFCTVQSNPRSSRSLILPDKWNRPDLSRSLRALRIFSQKFARLSSCSLDTLICPCLLLKLVSRSKHSSKYVPWAFSQSKPMASNTLIFSSVTTMRPRPGSMRALRIPAQNLASFLLCLGRTFRCPCVALKFLSWSTRSSNEVRVLSWPGSQMNPRASRAYWKENRIDIISSGLVRRGNLKLKTVVVVNLHRFSLG